MSLTSYPTASSSYKDIQNFIIEKNLTRKLVQLAGDLDLIRQREANPEAFISKAKQSTALYNFNQRIDKSIEEIIDIRKSLGIEQPQSRKVARILPLEELLKPEKGLKFNSVL